MDIDIHTHTFYAYYILVFYKGENSNMSALKHLFHEYFSTFCQVINKSKSTIISGSTSARRANHFIHLTSEVIFLSIT